MRLEELSCLRVNPVREDRIQCELESCRDYGTFGVCYFPWHCECTQYKEYWRRINNMKPLDDLEQGGGK